ncbi:MAG: VTT domain-containing protein [Acidobacteriota bacterium]
MGRFRQALIAWGPLGVFLTCVIESAGVPSPGGSDALILLVTIARPDTAWTCAIVATLGSLVGSVIFHAIVATGGEKFLERRTSTPRGMKVRAWFQRYGMASVFVCALVPFPFMPLRIVCLCACALGVSRMRFLGVTLAARLPRYAAIAYLGAELGENSSKWLGQHVWQMGVLAAVLLVGIYGLLRYTDRHRAPVGVMDNQAIDG